MKKHIPNIITGFNAVSGCIAIYLAFNNELVLAAAFIFLGAIFDFLDGFSARLLNAYSNIGKEMDSLADVISFGFAPTAIAYSLLSTIENKTIMDLVNGDLSAFIILIPFVMVIFSALRLAKFNLDERQTSSFIGMPTPSNALLWASLPLAATYGNIDFIQLITNSSSFIIFMSIFMSYLLVAEIPMFSFKIKSLKPKENIPQFSFIVILIGMFVGLKISAFAFIIPVYILISLLNNLFGKKK